MNRPPLPPARRPKRPRKYWLARLMRGWRLYRNPLRRRSDRVETVVLGVLLAAFLAGRDRSPRMRHGAGLTPRRPVKRGLSSPSFIGPTSPLRPRPAAARSRAAPRPEANARWKAPDGQGRIGEVYVPDGGRAGSTVLIWVSPSGQQTDPPLQSGQIAGRADLAGMAAVLALAAVLI